MDPFRKQSWLSKWWMRWSDYEKYKNQKFIECLHSGLHPVPLVVQEKQDIHFKHSGNMGDVIYSLPTIYTLSRQGRAHVHLNPNVKGHYGKKAHPLGQVMLSEKAITMLRPLLLAQPQIASCDIYGGSQSIDYDLDVIRKYPFSLKFGNIARWYFLVYAMNADLGKPWLAVDADTQMRDFVVVARSQRHQAPGIDYSFLRKFDKLMFVGVEAEFHEMRSMVPKIDYRPVSDFLEMARMIAGCRFFIGNQSFPFSLAEGLKVRRLLEVYHLSPNVNVEGPDGYDFCYQPQFEALVHKLYSGK